MRAFLLLISVALVACHGRQAALPELELKGLLEDGLQHQRQQPSSAVYVEHFEQPKRRRLYGSRRRRTSGQTTQYCRAGNQTILTSSCPHNCCINGGCGSKEGCDRAKTIALVVGLVVFAAVIFGVVSCIRYRRRMNEQRMNMAANGGTPMPMMSMGGMAPQAQQQQQQQVQVVVPQGMGPGQQLQVNAGGQMMMVVIPQGVGAGMAFAVAVPPPQQQMQMQMATQPQMAQVATMGQQQPPAFAAAPMPVATMAAAPGLVGAPSKV
jgi:hypothetical protein